jgi:predicted ATPase
MGPGNGLSDDGTGAATLARALRLSWSSKANRGCFLRAESFFNICSQLDTMPEVLDAYGGVPLHERSHGEAFLALFSNRFSGRGLYLMDEPEAALSPQRQLTFLLIIDELLRSSAEAQVIVASHSPIILAYPRAQIVSFDDGRLHEIAYQETPAYRTMSAFMRDAEGYVARLLRED